MSPENDRRRPTINFPDGEEGRFSKDGVEKAIALLIELGPERSTSIFKYLLDEELDALSSSTVRLQRVNSERRASILQEAQQEAVDQGFITGGESESVLNPVEQPDIAEMEERLLKMQEKRRLFEEEVFSMAESHPESFATLIREWMEGDDNVKSSPR